MPTKNGSAALGLNEEQLLQIARNPEAVIRAAQEAAVAREAEQRRREEELQEKRQEGRRRMGNKQRYATGVAWYDELDDEGQMRAIAEANLKAYGTITPPVEQRLAPLSKECPSCGETKPVLSGFGVRMYRGVPRSQSQCKTCRKEAVYKARSNGR
jgi:hypothetical protein